jgi:amino acid transporter
MMWGGALVLLGATKTFSEIGTHHVVIALCILLISNIMIYSAVQKTLKYIDAVHRLASYITVFYERKDITCKEDKKHGLWEIAGFEMYMKRRNEADEKVRSWNIIVLDFSVASLVSTILMSICVFYLLVFRRQDLNEPEMLIYSTLILSLAFFCISVILTYNILKEDPQKHREGNRFKWLHIFFDYALDIGYYTEADVLERFGTDFLKTINYRISVPSKKEKSD